MADQSPTRRLAAIVALDVAGYSLLMGMDEEGTLAALKRHRGELVDPKIEEYGGRIVKTTGDGLLIEFPSVIDAVRCCLEVQQEMAARNQPVPVDRRIQFRVGINLGDVILDGDDIFGDGVNIAARLETVADPGGICISGSVRDQVRHKLSLELADLGSIALKNIEEPVRSYRVLQAGPSQRPHGATALPADAVAPMPPLPKRPSLAILPFRNLSGNPASDYIADGIGLGIQTLLVQLSGLFMINACFDQNYREGKITAAQALRGLPIRYALEGAVQHAGKQVRVTAQLTELEGNTVLWADRYDRDLEDVFSLQDDVTSEVISSLSSELLGGDLKRIWTRSLAGDGAWEYFLRGISHIYKFNREDNRAAREMFEKIYALHPDKVAGPAYIALTHWLDATRGWVEDPAASLEQTALWAERAVITDEENNGLGYVILGSLRLRERQFDEALALCRKGVAFRANCPFALGQLAVVQNYCGDSQAAVKSARAALSVRMVYPPPLVNTLAMAYRDSGELGLSIPAAQEAARLDSKHTDALVTLCTDYALAGDERQAREAAEAILVLNPAFRISDYAAQQPYRDQSKLEQVAQALQSAGLPE
jgi:adenylate cyclase